MRRKTNVFVIRQVFLEIAVCLIWYTTGISLAFSSVLTSVILAPGSDIKATPDQASSIAIYLNIGSLVGFAFIPMVFEIFGRKTASVVTNLFSLIGSLILYISKDIYSLAFARLSQGLSIGGTIISTIGLCECIAPQRRGYFVVLNKVALSLGVLTCDALRFVLNWRQIALFGVLANLLSIIIFVLSSESPSFLAIRGQFDKCAETFEWYRGNTLNAKEELKELVFAQKESLRKKEKHKNISIYKYVKDMLMAKEFQKSLSIITMAILCLDPCGRYFASANTTEFFIELPNNLALLIYTSVATDIISIFALVISAVLVKHFKRRPLLFISGFCSVFLMCMVSFSIILKSKIDFLHDLKWLTSALILLHIFITNTGLIPVTYVLIGEVFSLDHRGFGSFMSGITLFIFFHVIMKLTPFMMDVIGVEGTYSIYGFLLFIFLVLLKTILLETKDKTLQQIADEIKGIQRNDLETELLKHSKFGTRNC